MEVYISINGVLRNLIQKFEYHYNNNFIDVDVVVDEGVTPFDYKVTCPIRTDNLLRSFNFQSKEEFNNFLYIDYPLEIFGHSTLSYPAVITDLNKLIYENPDINFTIVGIDEYGKAKSSTLFFLSKYIFLGNNIKFIKSDDIEKEWKKCDLWITDSADIIFKCPKNKKAVKFLTDYNQNYPYCNEKFPYRIEINNLTKINELCLKSLEPTITSTLTQLLKRVGQLIRVSK